MSRIALLPSELADQIAAGEVIERPANVVKELVENAIDAGATHITVDAKGAGLESITVTDNGHGMSADDLKLSVMRHATSKIRHFDELLSLTTMGFRGEALPSIASVSKCKVRSKTLQDQHGTELVIEGGSILGSRPVGMQVGTTVVVEQLFYNVPARKKFLRAPPTEMAHIKEVCLKAALANPSLHLTLFRDGRPLHYLPTTHFLERAKQLLAVNAAHQSIQASHPYFKIEGLILDRAHHKSHGQSMYLFVNGRPVKDRALLRSITTALGDTIAEGMFPSGAVAITLHPSEVDINVHPQKTEVRFAQPQMLFQGIGKLISHQLNTFPSAKNLKQSPFPLMPKGYVHSAARAGIHPLPKESTLPDSNQASIRFLGVVDSMWLMFQHPTHIEWINLHSLFAWDTSRTLRKDHSKELLFPYRIPLNRHQRNSLETLLPELESLGVHGTFLGHDVWVLRSLPHELHGIPPDAVAQHMTRILKEPNPAAPFALRSSLACFVSDARLKTFTCTVEAAWIHRENFIETLPLLETCEHTKRVIYTLDFATLRTQQAPD